MKAVRFLRVYGGRIDKLLALQKRGRAISVLDDMPVLDAFETWLLDFYMSLRATRGAQRVTASEIKAGLQLLAIPPGELWETAFVAIAHLEADSERYAREVEDANANP